MAGRRFGHLTVLFLETMIRQQWGHPSTMMGPLVEQLGPIHALHWILRNNRRYNRTVRTLGPLRTHLVCTTISMFNGCQYCTYGHAYAVELHHLRQHDRLFPVDAATMVEWAGLPRAELRSRLRDALMQAELHVELIWVDRALDLADGGRPIDGEERQMGHLVSALATMNAVCLASRPAFDAAHDPLNKDARLKTRLAALRAAQ